MNAIFITILLLTDIIIYLIFFDVILSWLSLMWIKFRPKFLAEIVDPIYKSIKKVVPTIFWPFEFAPFMAILILWFIQQLIFAYDWELLLLYRDLLKF